MTTVSFSDGLASHETYMKEALAEAEEGARQGEVVKVPRGGAVRRASKPVEEKEAASQVDGLGRPSYGRLPKRRRGCQRTARVDRPQLAGGWLGQSEAVPQGVGNWGTALLCPSHPDCFALPQPPSLSGRKLRDHCTPSCILLGRSHSLALRDGSFRREGGAGSRHDRVDSHWRTPQSGRPPGPDRAKPRHPGRSASRPASTPSDPAKGL